MFTNLANELFGPILYWIFWILYDIVIGCIQSKKKKTSLTLW